MPNSARPGRQFNNQTPSSTEASDANDTWSDAEDSIELESTSDSESTSDIGLHRGGATSKAQTGQRSSSFSSSWGDASEVWDADRKVTNISDTFGGNPFVLIEDESGTMSADEAWDEEEVQEGPKEECPDCGMSSEDPREITHADDCVRRTQTEDSSVGGSSPPVSPTLEVRFESTIGSNGSW